jgi:hypothetical protein
MGVLLGEAVVEVLLGKAVMELLLGERDAVVARYVDGTGADR